MGVLRGLRARSKSAPGLAALAGLLLLGGCAATSHPDYQPVFQRQSVTPAQLQQIEQRLRGAGIGDAALVTDSLGRVQLAGSYDDERQVEQALAISRSVVGKEAVSDVRPQNIQLKDWEISANKAFAAFLEALAHQSRMSVQLEQQGSDQQILVADRTLDGLGQFEVGSSEPTERVARFYRQMAQELARRGADNAAMKRLLIVGHTDDVGDSAQNAALSERRARAIGRICAEAGIAPSRIFYQGAGEVFPIGDNRTDEGRAKNRRVEIVDLTDDRKFEAYLAGRRPNLQLYRPPVVPPQTTASTSAQVPKAASAPPPKAAVPPAVPPARPPLVASAPAPSPTSSPTPTPAPAPAVPTTPPVKSATPPPARPAVAVKPPAPAAAPPPSPPTTASAKPLPADEVPSPPPPVAPTDLAPGEIDFGGRPANGRYRAVDIGKASRSGFGFISSAFADELPVGSCAEDRPRVSGEVKSLSDGQARHRILDYMPGAARATWGAKVNGHYVGFSHVAVLRPGTVPAEAPTFLVWRNWSDGSTAPADVRATVSVNTYPGDRALLYRAFPTSGPVRCVDLVISRQAPNTAPTSNLIYSRGGTLYQADYAPSIVR